MQIIITPIIYNNKNNDNNNIKQLPEIEKNNEIIQIKS